MKYIELIGVLIWYFLMIFVIWICYSREIEVSKESSSDAICQKYFNTDSAVVSIKKARAVHHKQDRPNTITIKCESK